MGCDGNHYRRRDFLRVGALSFLGISLSQLLELQSAAAGLAKKVAAAQGCILLWLQGGPSQMDTWDPKPNSNFRPISTNVAGIQISELYPTIAQHMDKLAIIRSIQSEENNHEQGTHYALTGHRPTAAMEFPSLGSIITRELRARGNIPPYIIPKMGTVKYEEVFNGQFIGSQYDPMVIPDPSQEDFRVPDLSLPQSISVETLEDRRSFLKVVDTHYARQMKSAERTGMDAFQEQALSMILSPVVREAFDLSRESQKVRDRYGRNIAGMGLLLARRLIEAGSRFVTVAGDGGLQAWDTHRDNDSELRRLSPRIDQGLSALLEDLDQRGLLGSTVVIVMGEFGRTPHINALGGRDHWPHCWSLVLGGGGIQGGQFVGASDERGAYVADRRFSVGDVFATLYKALGIDWHKEYMHPIGRPVKIANSIDDETGIPIPELI